MEKTKQKEKKRINQPSLKKELQQIFSHTHYPTVKKRHSRVRKMISWFYEQKDSVHCHKIID